MKIPFFTLAVATCLMAVTGAFAGNPGASEPPSGLSDVPAEAHSMTLKTLMDKDRRVLHQVNASLDKRRVIRVQEIWIDLATKEYKQLVRETTASAVGGVDPLADLGSLLQLKPTHGTWKTTYGGMGYRADLETWVPAVIRAEAPLRDIFRRVRKDWYLWPATSGAAAQCCGQAAAPANGDAESQLQTYKKNLEMLSSSASAMSIREQDGLISDIVLGPKGASVLHVQNEYLKDSPIGLDAKAGEALRQRSSFAPIPFTDGPKTPATGRGFGILLASGDDGPVIHMVQPNSPAAAAGIVAGDKILAIDGTNLSEKGAEAFDKLKGAKSVQLNLQRVDGSSYSVNLTKSDWQTQP